MSIILETDLGHDPDDYFAICYLAAAGVKIDAITLTPGDQDQLLIARTLCKGLGINCPIGVSKPDRTKYSSGGMYYDILKKYGVFNDLKAYFHLNDGLGHDVIKSVWNNQDIIIIGPATNVKNALPDIDVSQSRLYFQGGFLPYSQNPYPIKQIDKFVGQEVLGTFNFNGDKKAVHDVIAAPFKERRFIGKHICHTVEIKKGKTKFVSNDTTGAEMFIEALDILFRRTDSKKFHDPLVAAEYVNPFLTYVPATIYHKKGGWGAYRDESSKCQVVADIDYEKFWARMFSFGVVSP